jgi:hypothetical protein
MQYIARTCTQAVESVLLEGLQHHLGHTLPIIIQYAYSLQLKAPSLKTESPWV